MTPSAAVLHKYKHIAGNTLKLDTPAPIYLNEADKHTANYACLGEKSATSFSTTNTRFTLPIKALSHSTMPCKEELCLPPLFLLSFFLIVCQVVRQMDVSEVFRFHATQLCDSA